MGTAALISITCPIDKDAQGRPVYTRDMDQMPDWYLARWEATLRHARPIYREMPPRWSGERIKAGSETRRYDWVWDTELGRV